MKNLCQSVRRKQGFGRQVESLVGYKRKGEPILKSRVKGMILDDGI